MTPTTLDSSLLYTRADGTQDFVHDTLRDFFLARWISQSEDNLRFFWSEIANPSIRPDQERELDRRIKSGEVVRGDSMDNYAIRLLPYHELGLVKNMLKIYCELVPDASPLIETGMELADEMGDGLTAGKPDEIRMNLATAIIDANYVSPDTIDKFIQLLLKHGGGYGFTSHLQWTSEMILSFIIETGRDPYDSLMECHNGNEERVLRRLGETYRGIGQPEESIKYFRRLMDISTDLGAWDYIHFAHTYMSAGKFSDAIDLLNEGKKLFPYEEPRTLGFIDQGIRMAKDEVYDEFWLF